MRKTEELTEGFSGDRFFGSFDDDPALVDEVKEILTEIAGENEGAMLSEDDAAELLHSRDIYHFQAEAVRQVRKFLSA